MLPNDPVMLLSFVNTKLRDQFSSLDAFLDEYDISLDEIESKLAAIDYHYDAVSNQFK